MLKHFNWRKNYLKYGIAAIILAVPLYPKFPFLAIPGTYVSVRIEDFLVLAVTIAFLVLNFSKIKDFWQEKIERSVFIYLCIGFLSLLSAVFLTKTVTPFIGLLHLLRRVEYFVPLLLGIYALRNNEIDLEFFLKLFLIDVFIIFIYGFGQKYFSWPVIITQNEEYAKGVALRWIPGSHINSTFAGHYDLATYLVLILPVFVSLFVVLKNIKVRVILGGSILAGYWLMANAISRISIVSFMGSTVIALVLLKKFKAIALFLVISVVIFGMSSDLRARYVSIIDVLQRQIEKVGKRVYIQSNTFVYAAEDVVAIPVATPTPLSTSTPVPVQEDRSTSIRLNVEWPRAIRAFLKNPLLGTGYSSITLATDNDYLRALGETGILGFVGLFLIFTQIGNLVLRSIPISENMEKVKRAFLCGCIGAIPGFLLNAFFIDVFESSKVAIMFWLLVGFIVSLIRNNYYEQNN